MQTDYTTDTDLVHIVRLKEASLLPDWVQEVPDADDVKNLPHVSFGDPHQRLFPLHSKVACYLSAVHADVVGLERGPVVQRIKAACAAYGILSEVKQAHEFLKPPYHEEPAPAIQKAAHAIELVINEGEAPTPFYPIGTKMQIEFSAGKLASDIAEERLPRSWFAEACRAMVKAASELDYPLYQLPRSIMDLSEDRIPSSEVIASQLERRKAAGMQDQVVSLCKEAYESSLESGEFIDAACFWEKADRLCGISYDNGLLEPVRAFNSGITTKRAHEIAEEIFAVDDTMIPWNAFEAVPSKLLVASFPREKAAALLQAQIASDRVKLACAIDMLAPTDKIVFLNLLLGTDV